MEEKSMVRPPPPGVTEGLIYQQNVDQIERCMDQNLGQFI